MSRSDRLLAIILAIPSLYLVESRLHDWAVPVYVGYVVAAVAVWRSAAVRASLQRLGERRARALLAATMMVLIVGFAILYPIAQSGLLGGGSDTDEALNQATGALLHGRYPYHQRTYLGNEITPMPGELILAAPFYLLGNGVYQTFFWMAVGVLTLRVAWNRDSARALGFTWLVLAACPAVLHQLVIGGDYIPNAVMVLVAILLVCGATPRLGLRGRALAALFLGLALASRANYLFLVPIVFASLVRTQGLRRAVVLTGLACSAAAAVTVPFYVADPHGFSPLHTATKLGALEHVLPHGRVILIAFSALVSLMVARPSANVTTAQVLRNCALSQAAVLLPPALVWAFSHQGRPLAYSAFILLALPFALAAWVAGLDQPIRVDATTPARGDFPPRQGVAAGPP